MGKIVRVVYRKEYGDGNLKCSKCGRDSFLNYGESYIAGYKFYGFRCVSCKEGLAVETTFVGEMINVSYKNVEKVKISV
jgi:hypothetical protein